MLMHKIVRSSAFRRCVFIGLLIICMPLSPDLAQAQEDCRAKLQQAEQEFTNTRFDEAIALLTACLEKDGFTQPDKQRAYRLLGLAYLAKDYIEQAKSAINRLLDLVPMYQPDPDQDPPIFIQMFEKVKSERQQRQTGSPSEKKPPEVKKKKGGGGKWLLIGGLVVAAGGGAALALGGSGGGGTTPPPPTIQTLPTPPPLP
jgi:tetratricopeptide (TPR) repeat protein